MLLRLSLLVLVAASCTAATDPRILLGLEKGEQLLAELTKDAFPIIVDSLVDWTMPFMKALELLVTVAAQDEASQEAAQFRQLFTEYNRRLRVMSSEFEDVRRHVDWSAIKTGFGEYERTIIALKQNIAMVLNSPNGARAEQKRFFIKQFESGYNNAASKLYTSLVEENLLFSDNLIKSVRHYTRDNRALVRHFLMGSYKLLLEGMELESTYLIFNNFTSSVDYIETQWGTRLQNIKKVFAKVDEDIESKWSFQSGLDVDDFAGRKFDLGLTAYANELHKLLTGKFWWRSWVVLTYDPVWTFNNHAIGSCNTTVIRFRQNGKNIVVSSVDRATSNFNATDANRVLDTMTKQTPSWQKDKPLYFLQGIMAAADMTEESCTKFAMAAVLVNKVNHALVADKGRTLYRVHSAKAVIYTYKFKTILFG